MKYRQSSLVSSAPFRRFANDPPWSQGDPVSRPPARPAFRRPDQRRIVLIFACLAGLQRNRFVFRLAAPPALTCLILWLVRKLAKGTQIARWQLTRPNGAFYTRLQKVTPWQ